MIKTERAALHVIQGIEDYNQRMAESEDQFTRSLLRAKWLALVNYMRIYSTQDHYGRPKSNAVFGFKHDGCVVRITLSKVSDGISLVDIMGVVEYQEPYRDWVTFPLSVRARGGDE